MPVGPSWCFHLDQFLVTYISLIRMYWRYANQYVLVSPFEVQILFPRQSRAHHFFKIEYSPFKIKTYLIQQLIRHWLWSKLKLTHHILFVFIDLNSLSTLRPVLLYSVSYLLFLCLIVVDSLRHVKEDACLLMPQICVVQVLAVPTDDSGCCKCSTNLSPTYWRAHSVDLHAWIKVLQCVNGQ